MKYLLAIVVSFAAGMLVMAAGVPMKVNTSATIRWRRRW